VLPATACTWPSVALSGRVGHVYVRGRTGRRRGGRAAGRRPRLRLGGGLTVRLRDGGRVTATGNCH
jgi:hypothetical protein